MKATSIAYHGNVKYSSLNMLKSTIYGWTCYRIKRVVMRMRVDTVPRISVLRGVLRMLKEDESSSMWK